MLRGERTHETILDRALSLASVVGLEGLSIGTLASHTGLSKSGLFAHFGSKETLQVETLKAAADRFRERVVRPALHVKRGLLRLRALFDNWLEWATKATPGGCLFVAASFELDDQEGPVRDYLVSTQQQWLDTVARVAKTGVETGEFRSDLDTEQFAHDLMAIYLGFHYANRLFRDPEAEGRARNAFETLIKNAR